MKHIGVITGATGYIGSHLLKYLLQQGWEIHIIVQPEIGYSNIEDVKNRICLFEYNNEITSLISYFQKINADVVFHLAAAVITDYTPEQISTLIESNIKFGTEVLEAMKHCSTRLFIGTGSYWQNYNSDAYNPVDLYAATKEAFEKIIQYYVDAHGFRTITLRLYDVYGEDDKRPKLLNMLKNIAGTNKSIDVSPGEQYLDMVHISDVCSAYLCAYELLCLDKKITNEIYGVCTGRRIQLKKLIFLYSNILQQTINVNIGGKDYKKREIMNPTEKYSCLPNWKPLIDISNGLMLFRRDV